MEQCLNSSTERSIELKIWTELSLFAAFVAEALIVSQANYRRQQKAWVPTKALTWRWVPGQRAELPSRSLITRTSLPVSGPFSNLIICSHGRILRVLHTSSLSDLRFPSVFSQLVPCISSSGEGLPQNKGFQCWWNLIPQFFLIWIVLSVSIVLSLPWCRSRNAIFF